MTTKTSSGASTIPRILASVLRSFLRLAPRSLPSVARAARAVFSDRANNNVTVPALTGQRQLEGYRVAAGSLSVTFAVPARLKLNLADYTQSAIYFTGLPPLCATLMEHAQPDSYFFDIGANVGLVSVAVGNVVEGGRIHAFEANPDTCALLRENLDTNCPGAFAHGIALSDRAGKLELAVAPNDSGSSSLQAERFAGTARWHGQEFVARRVEVETVTFSSWARAHLGERWADAASALFKIDTEGHELPVLAGMSEALADTRARLLFIVEAESANIAAVTEFFLARGFSAHRPCWNPQLQESPHHTDLVFKRPAHGAA